MKQLTRRLFVAVCVAASLTMAPGCGNNQFTFIPNCLPSPESGPNVVAKVRYTVTSTKDNVDETKTFDTKLGDPFELPVNATIKLPVTVELLNADGAVLATRAINDPELVSRSADYPTPGTGGEGTLPDKVVTYVSALGNRYQDTWKFATAGKVRIYNLGSRVIHFVDVNAAAIACTTIVPTPTPTPTPTPSPGASPPPSPGATSTPSPGATPTPSPDASPTVAPATRASLRLTTTVTTSLPLQDQVVMSSSFKEGPDGLYALFRAASGGLLPERTGLGYSDIDALWVQAGGTVATHFQPGTLAENGTGKPTQSLVGEAIAPLVNAISSKVDVTLPWPTADQFNQFKSSDGVQRPVTGWVHRTYRYQTQTVLDLIGNQVTWGTAPKEVIQQQQSGGGGGGAVVLPAPTITSVTPSSGAIGTNITIAGTNFRAGATVTIGGIAATNVNVASATAITATVPAGLAAAAHNVVVTNTDATTVTLNNGYTVTATTPVGQTSSDTNYNPANPNTVGQTFTALGNFKLTQVVFNLSSTTTTPGVPICFDPFLGCPGAGEMAGAPLPANSNVTVTLYAVDGGGLPTGGALAASNTVVVATGQADNTFTFAGQPNLTSGTKYALVLSCAAGQSFQAFAKSGDPYAGGTALVGGPLAVVAGNDLRFQATLTP